MFRTPVQPTLPGLEKEFRAPARVPFRIAKKEPKGDSGALPLKTPFCLRKKSVFCSPCAPFRFAKERALLFDAAVLRTEEPFPLQQARRARRACQFFANVAPSGAEGA